MTDFDPEGKPCDNYQQCEDGYQCQVTNPETGEGICKSGGESSAAALTSAGSNSEAQGTGVTLTDAENSASNAKSSDSSSEGGASGSDGDESGASGGDLDIWDAPCDGDEDCADLDGYLCDTENHLCIPPA